MAPPRIGPRCRLRQPRGAGKGLRKAALPVPGSARGVFEAERTNGAVAMDGAALIDLGQAGPAARARVLALNAAHVRQTGPLDAAALDRLIAMSAAAPARADGRAFALVLPESADYESPNFLWFRAR